MGYYADKFNYPINIPLGYGMEFGKNWASLQDWDFRTDTLCDMLKEEGKRMELPYDKVIQDTKFIMKIREKELRKDPYKMLINGNNIARVFDGMHMFKDQLDGS